MSDSSTQPTEALRAEVANLEKIRQQISSDMEVLRQQEANLRVFETRLRDSRSPIPASQPADQATLDAEREKLSRLRALTEAERRALTDERLSVREEKFALERKAEEIKQREAWIDARERDFEAKASGPKSKSNADSKNRAPLFSTKIFSFGSKRTPVA